MISAQRGIKRLKGVEDGFGLACNTDGLFLGRTPLLERTATSDGFNVRRRPEIERLLRCAFPAGIPFDSLEDKLDTVARNLSHDCLWFAQIIAATLPIPDLPDRAARILLEAEDVLIRCERLSDPIQRAAWDPGQHPRAGGPPNPGWFAATAGDRPADSDNPMSHQFPARSVELAGYKPIHELPPDAIAVTLRDGTQVEDPTSTTGKLMAPPTADFYQVYRAGQSIADLNIASQIWKIYEALHQGGTYDFQRDKATMSVFTSYTNASNYAVGVYMVGAGHSLPVTLAGAEIYALRNSKNYGAQEQIEWIKRGWDDAQAGLWK